LKLLRYAHPDPNQLTLQLDFFTATPHQPSQDAPPLQLQSPPPAVDPAPLTEPPPLSPPIGRPADGSRRIQLGQHALDYVLLRSKRRSIGFLISDEGLRVTAPKWVTLGEIENSIREKQRWILSKLSERRERSARRLQPQMQWRDGATLPYLGQDLTLRIRTGQSIGAAYDEDTRELTISLPADAGEQQLKDRVQGWLQARAKEIFAARLPVYAAKLGVTYQSFALSSATTQWGSCTSDGRIRLNWRLMHFALPLIDYVIAHELSHLREMNHSPRFWATVQSIFPEFETAKRTLRESAPETLPIF
jgi:predicted metal-dependent hydrolase